MPLAGRMVREGQSVDDTGKKVDRARILRSKAAALEQERQTLLDACSAEERPFVKALVDMPGGADETTPGRWWSVARRGLPQILAVLSILASLPLLIALRSLDPTPLGVVVAIATIVLVLLLVLSLAIDLPSHWRNVSLVLESGSFYFFAGLALLFFAQRGSDAREHPSITFILAMLGVAIMLFGTGSQATGALATQGARLPPIGEPSGTTATATATEPSGDGGDGAPGWGLMKANAIIAGGAAVLTIVFGFGVIYYRDEIPRVFNDYGQYERILVKPCYTRAQNCVASDFTLRDGPRDFDFRSYEVTASNAEGEELFVRKSQGGFQILALPGEDLKIGRLVQVKLLRTEVEAATSDYEPSITLTMRLPDSQSRIMDGGDASSCLATLSTRSANCRVAMVRDPLDNREVRTTMDILSLNLVREAPDGALQARMQPVPDVPSGSLNADSLQTVDLDLR